MIYCVLRIRCVMSLLCTFILYALFSRFWSRPPLSFLFLASNGFDKEYIERLTFLFMYKTRSNKCLSVVAYFENKDDIEFRLDWMYMERDWEYDKLLEEVCNSLEVKKKWNPALILTHKVNK